MLRKTGAIVAIVAFLGIVCPAGDASASTVLYRTDAELVALSARVVHARVVAQRVTRGGPDQTIYTVSTLAVLEDFAIPDGNHLTLIGLFRSRVWNDDAGGCLTLFFQPLHDDAVVQRTNLHISNSSLTLDTKGIFPTLAPPTCYAHGDRASIFKSRRGLR